MYTFEWITRTHPFLDLSLGLRGGRAWKDVGAAILDPFQCGTGLRGLRRLKKGQRRRLTDDSEAQDARRRRFLVGVQHNLLPRPGVCREMSRLRVRPAKLR